MGMELLMARARLNHLAASGVSYVGACTPASGVGATSLNLGLPAGAQAGDVVVAEVVDSGASPTPTNSGPAGSQKIVATTFVNNTAFPSPVGGYIVRLSSTDITNGYVTFTLSGAFVTAVRGVVFRGVSSTALDVAVGLAASAVSTTTPFTFAAPGITTVTDGCMLVAVGSVFPANTTNLSTPTAYTLGDIGADDNILQQFAYQKQATHGATGDASMTYGSDTGSRGWCGWLVALRPAQSAITLSATFPSSPRVGDAINFDVTATLTDGATGTLTITVDALPDGLTLGSTSMVDATHYKATVSGTLTTVQDVTATFGATGGSVSATPLVHAFNVQAAATVQVIRAAGGLTAYTVPSNAPLQLAIPGVQQGDIIVIATPVNASGTPTLTATDGSNAWTTYTNYDRANCKVAALCCTANAAGALSVSIATSVNTNLSPVVYIVRGGTAIDAAHVIKTSRATTNVGTPLTIGPYSTAGRAVLLFFGNNQQGTSGDCSLVINSGAGFTEDLEGSTTGTFYTTNAYKIETAAAANESFTAQSRNVQAGATSLISTLLIPVLY